MRKIDPKIYKGDINIFIAWKSFGQAGSLNSNLCYLWVYRWKLYLGCSFVDFWKKLKFLMLINKNKQVVS